MTKATAFFIALTLTLATSAQKGSYIGLHLQPHRIKGGSVFNRNIRFEAYETAHFRRTLGSYFALRSLRPGNMVSLGGLPLIQRNVRQAKDVFRFDLYEAGSLLSTTTCQATLLQNESFIIFRTLRDSSFFGNRNFDLLEATIKLADDPAHTWELMATNLNGSKPEAQKGVITQDNTRIEFVRTMVVLKDKADNSSQPESMFSSLYAAYAFTNNNELIATVTVDERRKDRKLWLKPGLSKEMKDVIANTAVILSKRRDIYK